MQVKLSVNKKIFGHLERGRREGWPIIALQGARRSGKTYTTCQWLLLNMLSAGDVVIFASMTADQGKRGTYEDCQNILKDMGESVQQYFDAIKSPREIRCKTTVNGRSGIAYFASFQDPETAKGGACDWVFINEANKFTKQQYLDLAANARKGVIIDFNPNQHFWADDIPAERVLVCHWKDNEKHLTDVQKAWFQSIYDAAHKPDATAADLYYYNVYYEGKYSELSGSIFTRANIQRIDRNLVPWQKLRSFVLFGDPSALRGADYFPLVLSAMDDAENMYVLQTYSRNEGTKPEWARRMMQMAAQYDGVRIYIETNGLVGVDFFEFAQNSGIPVNGWYSRGDKFKRIVAKYHEVTHNVYFVEDAELDGFLAQVYEFAEKCEHDDNIDAVVSSYMLQKFVNM